MSFSGFTRLHAWFPDLLLQALDPRTLVGTDTLRTALTEAVSTTVFIAALSFFLSILGGLGRVFSSRALLVRTGRGLAFLRKVALMLTVGLPWYRVVQLVSGEPGSQDVLMGFALIAAAFWALLWAGDHGAAWLDPDARTLHLRRGFAIFVVRTTVIDLGLGLVAPLSNEPVGGQATDRLVIPRREVLDTVTEHLGDAQGRVWLRRAIGRIGLRPAPPGMMPG